MVEVGYGPRKEVHFLLPGRDCRHTDVLLPPFAGGQDAALDVTPARWPPWPGRIFVM